MLGLCIQETGGGEAFQDDVETRSELPLSISNAKYSLWTSPMGSAVHLDNLSHVTGKMSELDSNISAVDVTNART